MSKDTMERAIKRGAGGEDGATYEEVRYEGYGPGGIAVIVEALTDNRNRTASEVRSAFSKHGGTLGETNSVAFMFERKGVVRFAAAVASPDAMRSEEHTSELQSLMRISYAVFCLKKQKKHKHK